MGLLEDFAARIAGGLFDLLHGDPGNIRRLPARDVPVVIGGCIGQEINCYPGETAGGCCRILVIVSIHTEPNQRYLNHIKFPEAVRLLIRHMQGSCPGITQQALILTDRYATNEIVFWRPNLDRIKQNTIVECYLMDRGRVQQMPI